MQEQQINKCHTKWEAWFSEACLCSVYSALRIRHTRTIYLHVWERLLICNGSFVVWRRTDAVTVVYAWSVAHVWGWVRARESESELRKDYKVFGWNIFNGFVCIRAGAVCSALRNNKISVVGIEKLRRLINASWLVCGSVKSSVNRCMCAPLLLHHFLSQFICAVSVLYRGASIKEKRTTVQPCQWVGCRQLWRKWKETRKFEMKKKITCMKKKKI